MNFDEYFFLFFKFVFRDVHEKMNLTPILYLRRSLKSGFVLKLFFLQVLS